jgi:hypothetical protein
VSTGFLVCSSDGGKAESERKEVMTRMKSNSVFRISALLAVLALAIPVFAKPISKNIDIVQTARVGSVKLDVGNYRLIIDGTKATIKKGNHEVVESEGRWENRDAASPYDSVLLDANGQILEVRFAGKKSVFVFNQ